MDAMMQNTDLVLKADRLLIDESPLSPKKELAYRAVIQMLQEENAELKQQLANYKKMVYGQKSKKSEIVLAGGKLFGDQAADFRIGGAELVRAEFSSTGGNGRFRSTDPVFRSHQRVVFGVSFSIF